MVEGKWHTIAGNRFFVKNGKVLYGEKTFFGKCLRSIFISTGYKDQHIQTDTIKKCRESVNAPEGIEEQEHKVVTLLNHTHKKRFESV